MEDNLLSVLTICDKEQRKGLLAASMSKNRIATSASRAAFRHFSLHRACLLERVRTCEERRLLHQHPERLIAAQPSLNRSFTASSFNNQSSKSSPVADPRIQPRPPGESQPDDDEKFALPDKEKELELAKFQNHIQDFYKAGQYPRALSSSKDLLKETLDHFGELHPASASAHNNVGLFYKLLGDFDEARRHYQAAAKIYKTTVGKDHASYASVLHNLGNLNRSQVHFDTSLSATNRLSLMESAVDYLEQAHHIRLAERGPAHPHTVASRSSWGASLAAQILHHYKKTTTEDANTDNKSKKKYVSLLPASHANVTEQGWEACHEHLRQAFLTAVQNPRGDGLQSAKSKTAVRGRGRRGRGKQPSAAKTVPQDEHNKSSIQTLSAAAAAQNLAIFLKTRATTHDPHHAAWLQESHDLYRQVLEVRQALLPGDHPDLYATKHSLAELLEVMGEEEAATVLRQEVVDTYDPVQPSDDRKDSTT